MKNFGFNFSPWYCECLGLDWKETLSELIKLNPETIRISAHYNRIAKNENELDFDELNYIVNELKKNNIKIIMSVGVKAQRYPEYFLPSWLIKDYDSFGDFIKVLNSNVQNDLQGTILAFINQVVNKFDKGVDVWQVENEPLQASVPFKTGISESFLKREIELVKSLSSKNKVILNETDFSNSFLRILNGFSVKLGLFKGIKKFNEINAANIYYLISANLYKIKIEFKSDLRLQKNSSYTIVTELQSEPWPIPKVSDFTNELWDLMKRNDWKRISELLKFNNIIPTQIEDSISFDSSIIEKSYNIVKDSNLDTVLFWGTEYWIYRMKQGDSSWVNRYNSLINS